MGKKTDINIKIEDVNFVVRACAVIEYNGKILFQKKEADKYWALPGGKVEILKTGEETILRELEEEIGATKVRVDHFLSLTETFFEIDNNKFHQYILAYKVIIDEKEILEKETFYGIEKDKKIIYKWLDMNNLQEQLIKPDFLVQQLKSNLNNITFNSYSEKVGE